MKPARQQADSVSQSKPTLAKDLKAVRDAGLSVSSVERYPDGGYRIHTTDSLSLSDDLALARLRRAAKKAAS